MCDFNHFVQLNNIPFYQIHTIENGDLRFSNTICTAWSKTKSPTLINAVQKVERSSICIHMISINVFFVINDLHFKNRKNMKTHDFTTMTTKLAWDCEDEKEVEDRFIIFFSKTLVNNKLRKLAFGRSFSCVCSFRRFRKFSLKMWGWVERNTVSNTFNFPLAYQTKFISRDCRTIKNWSG